MSSQESKHYNPISHFLRRIEECSQDTTQGPVTIVALGDSVTAGAGPGNVVYVDEVYHARLRVLLEQRYPTCTFRVVNAGIGGEIAAGGLARFEESVVAHNPDLLIVAYGLNDATGGIEGLALYRATIEALIQRSRETGAADIMLITPNMMPFYAADNVPEQWSHCTENFIKLQREGVLAAFANCLKAISKEQGVVLANVYGGWEKLHSQGVDTTAMLVNGLNHPDEEGHSLAARVIMNVIESQGASA